MAPPPTADTVFTPRPSPCDGCVKPLAKAEAIEGEDEVCDMTVADTNILMDKDTSAPQEISSPLPKKSQENYQTKPCVLESSASTAQSVRCTTPPSTWPEWSSSPPTTLGNHVRNIFLDLCDGRRVDQLQHQFPHEWAMLVDRLRTRPDIRAELLSLAKQG